MSPAHLVFEEPGQQEALRARGLHHLAVGGVRRIEHERVEHLVKAGRGGEVADGMRRDLRVVSEHAGVVQQLLAIDRRIREFLQTLVEEFECQPVITCQ